jgi:hypothetical protein
VGKVVGREYEATEFFAVPPLKGVERGNTSWPGAAVFVVDQGHEALQAVYIAFASKCRSIYQEKIFVYKF